jgi:hypothetical protein
MPLPIGWRPTLRPCSLYRGPVCPTTSPNVSAGWSPTRSTFINGEDVIVDGGLVRGRLFTPQQTGLRQIKSMLGLND